MFSGFVCSLYLCWVKYIIGSGGFLVIGRKCQMPEI